MIFAAHFCSWGWRNGWRTIENTKELCLKGVSTRQIAMRLTEMGIPTQRGFPTWNRTVVLQHFHMRETEVLLARLSNVTERNQKLLTDP
jgi:hypothetical protein